MRKVLLLIFIILFSLGFSYSQRKDRNPNVDYNIDNQGYWKKMAEKGYVSLNPVVEVPKAIYKSSKINSKSVKTEDSPDVAITTEIEQTETSVFVDPSDNNHVLNSNNSGNSGSFYGTSSLFTTDGSQNPWDGTVQSAGGGNSGDPAAIIGLNGRRFIGFINSASNQGVAYSDNGTSWTSVVAGTTSGSVLDKNHLWIDNSSSSSYEGNVYDAWTDFGGSMNYRIGFVRSTDNGLTYSTPINLSSAVGGYLHQGVNINSGPNGEVYVIWTIYDSSGSLSEDAIGFAKSMDGGATFGSATRIIDNTKGIRDHGVAKNMRVNSFPVMATNMQNGEIYVVFSNIGFPGTNTGTNISVYMIKSSDNGDSWSTPVRVNQGPNIDGKEAYLPWITCDPETGILSVIYYDDRDVSSTQVETWVSNSFDGGDTWEALRVSDVAFTPSPLPGMASGYMGDYLGISARGGKVYPVWPDNRTGTLYTYCSVYETNNRPRPTDLNIVLTETTGQTDLKWTYSDDDKAFQHFIVYRDNSPIGTTIDTIYTDNLPNYGIFSYSVSAMHDDGESSFARKSVQWGNPNISVTPSSLSESLMPNQTSTQVLTVNNIGELDLIYNISTQITSKKKNPNVYCSAGGGGDEYISGVVFGNINNTGTSASGYSDFTAMSTDVDSGNTYPITITNGNSYSSDDLGIWIDWNQDEDFDDVGENVICEGGNGAEGTFDIVVPSDALGGETRMRIRIKYTGSDCGSPCGTTTYGEVEDYSINVNSWLKVIPSETDTINPGSSKIINVNYNSEDLAEGIYNATIKFNSNATDNPVIEIPVTLNVSLGFNSTILADNNPLCMGSSTVLHANAGGGSGTYTYSWTSDPVGFTSSDENVTISPTENTTYTVVVNDGTEDVSDDIFITIADLPNVTLAEFDDVLLSSSAFVLTGGAPSGGIYTGDGVSLGQFVPGLAGLGSHVITYNYTDVNGCENSAQQTINVVETIEVSSLENNINVNIYPNPTSGFFNLALSSNDSRNLKFKISNQVGLTVYEKNISFDHTSKTEIDLSRLPSGVYFLSVKGIKTNIIRKIVIQK